MSNNISASIENHNRKCLAALDYGCVGHMVRPACVFGECTNRDRFVRNFSENANDEPLSIQIMQKTFFFLRAKHINAFHFQFEREKDQNCLLFKSETRVWPIACTKQNQLIEIQLKFMIEMTMKMLKICKFWMSMTTNKNNLFCLLNRCRVLCLNGKMNDWNFDWNNALLLNRKQ